MLSCVPATNNLFSNLVATDDSGSSLLYTATPEKTALLGAPVSFVMQTNLTLTGNFDSNSFGVYAGKYNGLFNDTNGVAHESAGYIRFKTDSKLKFSGALVVQGEKVGFAGLFNLAGKGTQKKLVFRKNLFTETFLIYPQIDLTGNGKITGTILDEAIPALSSAFLMAVALS